MSKYYRIEDIFGTLLDNPKIILDIGANSGREAAWFGAEYPNAEIHMFEPLPCWEEVLIEKYPDERYKFYRMAVTSSDGEAIFNLNMENRDSY